MSGILIRKALPDDAAALLAVYAPYVAQTAVSFEYQPPDVEEFRSRIERFSAEYPYLAAEEDGEIIGYAYAHAFHERAAFSHSAELSVYIDRACRGRGLGRRLYEKLELLLAEKGVTNLYALVAVPQADGDPYLTYDSFDFHRHMGFSEAGRLHGCGLKFGRLYDLVYMEKIIQSRRTS